MTNNSLNESEKEMIRQWYYKSLPDYFSAFTTLWIAFNAYYKRKFPGSGGDHNMVKSLYKDPKHQNLFDNLLKGEDFSKAVENLMKELCSNPLRNMDTGKEYKIHDKRKMEEVFEVLYIVRNNLFHGDKKIDIKRDEKIVKLSYQILRLFMKEIISKDFKK